MRAAFRSSLRLRATSSPWRGTFGNVTTDGYKTGSNGRGGVESASSVHLRVLRFARVAGYDFLLDENLHVWLLEVNSSPTLEHSTPVTSQLCPQMVDDLMKVRPAPRLCPSPPRAPT